MGKAGAQVEEAPVTETHLKTPRIELSIPAQSEWVRVARLTVAGVAARQGFSIEAVEDIKVAVSEAINNAIQHGGDEDDEEMSMVAIVLEPRADGLWIVVSDQGRLEGELPVRTPSPEDGLPEGGMGLLLIRSLMDRVELQSGPDLDTALKMWKSLPVSKRGRSLAS